MMKSLYIKKKKKIKNHSAFQWKKISKVHFESFSFITFPINCV